MDLSRPLNDFHRIDSVNMQRGSAGCSMTNAFQNLSMRHRNVPWSKIDYLALKRCGSFARTDITGLKLHRFTAKSFQCGILRDLLFQDTLEFPHETHSISRVLCNCLIHRTSIVWLDTLICIVASGKDTALIDAWIADMHHPAHTCTPLRILSDSASICQWGLVHRALFPNSIY